MKYFEKLFLIFLLTLLFVGLGCSWVMACNDKFSITVPEQYIFNIDPDALSSIPSGQRYTASAPLNVEIEVPGQGNDGNKWILTWRLVPVVPISGADNQILTCQGSVSGSPIKNGIGDQSFSVLLALSLPVNTPPGEYVYDAVFTNNMGAQGQGSQVSDTTRVIIRVPSFYKIWTVPVSVSLSYAGPDGVGAKEDLVYVYVRSNIPWKVMFHMTDPNPVLPLDAIVTQTSAGVTGTMGQWAPITTALRQIGFGPPTNESWILLRLRCDSSCTLTPGEYPFKIGFELGAN